MVGRVIKRSYLVALSALALPGVAAAQYGMPYPPMPPVRMPMPAPPVRAEPWMAPPPGV